MAGEDVLVMRQEDLKRLHIIRRVLEKRLRGKEAGEILDLSPRQIRRISRRVKEEGDKGILHKSRGQPSNRRIPAKTRDKVIELYRLQYGDFGPTLASEKLLERDELKVNRETLRGWLLESGDWNKRRKSRGHRRWREPKGHYGEMVQMDGSHHDWFEGRGPQCVLMGYIDDATGKVFGRFYEYEGTIPAMDSFKRYMGKYGLPLSVYLDRHTTYKSSAKVSPEELLNGEGAALSQFERALNELGVKVIHAYSPQAKGRVERLFGTLQDRLVKEMRLQGIRTIQEANTLLRHYLPLYNRRFSYPAKDPQDLHRSLGKGINLGAILCIKTQRRLRNDFTITHDKKLYQIEDKIRGSKVLVQDHLDGSMKILYRDQALRFHEIRTRPPKQQPAPRRKARTKPLPPGKAHPWRQRCGRRPPSDPTSLRLRNNGMLYGANNEELGEPF